MVMILPLQVEVKDHTNFKTYSTLLKGLAKETNNSDHLKEIISKVDMVDKIEWGINSRI